MRCSPCLQLLRFFNLIAAAHVDFALMKLWLGCPIFTWLAPCPCCSKYWQCLSRTPPGTSVTWGRGGGKKHVEFTLADGRMAHPGNSSELGIQIFLSDSWQCPMSVESVSRHRHTLMLLSLLSKIHLHIPILPANPMERGAWFIHNNHCDEIGVYSFTSLGTKEVGYGVGFPQLLQLWSTNSVLGRYSFIPTHALSVKILHSIF